MNRRSYTGQNNPKWRGGKINVGGYIYIHKPRHPRATRDGYVVEHRLVMEKELGRFLHPKEVVHHINHDKQDNRIENLFLTSSPEHTKIHMKGFIQSPEHIKKRFANRRKPDMSRFSRDSKGRFIGVS